MEIILKQDVKHLGYKDDVVKVRPGYGRNYLIPQGLAELATPSARKVLAENMKQAQFKQEKLRKDADALAAAMKEANVILGAKAGETGKIFGAVTTLQLSEAIKKLGYDVDRRNITFESDVKMVGKHLANLNLHREVKVQIEFEVVAE